MIIKKIMETKKISETITVKPTMSIASAAEILAANRIGAVVVSEDGVTLGGILSERDIVRALGTTGSGCMSQEVRELMTAEVEHCSPEDTTMSAMERMSKGRFRHMPVVEDNKMVGLISIGDVVNARILEIQEENSALTGMISNSW